MNENSANRLHEVFFYGLYMDPDILRQKQVEPRNPRKAMVNDYMLCIGHKATLLRAPAKKAYGMVYSLTHAELDSLYWGAGLHEYRSEALLAHLEDGGPIAVLCCNLLEPPTAQESNDEYAGKLQNVLNKLGLPVLFV